jgi:cell division septation protein DedD
LPKNEDGEFELVLGNKQLLSMFFVVVVLLGVFFIMGYIVGRNSAPLVAEVNRKPEAKPLVVDSPAPKQTPAPETQVPFPGPSPAPAASPEPEKPAEKAEKTAPAKSEPAPKASVAAQSTQTTPGATYLQLSATDKPDADKMVEELRKNGFPALASEVPEKLGTFRVLVGPIAGGDVNKMRADLQSKSFPGDKAIVKKF